MRRWHTHVSELPEQSGAYGRSPGWEGADLAQPTNAVTAEYLRKLYARRAPGGSSGTWRKRSELERLLDRTVLELHPTLGTCWIWTGVANPYGRIAKAQDAYTIGWAGSCCAGPSPRASNSITAVSGTPAGTPTT